MKMILRKNVKKVDKLRRIDRTLLILGTLALLVVAFNLDHPRDRLLLLTIFLMMYVPSYMRGGSHIAAPHIELADGILIVDGHRIAVDEIDLDRSTISNRRLKLRSRTSWKDTIRADLSLLDADDVRQLEQAMQKP